MFNLSFYLICWLGILLLCLPIIFSGLLAVAFEDESVEIKHIPLSEISAQIERNINNKETLKELKDSFLTHYKSYANDEEDYPLWLDIISRFAVNMNLMSVDEVVNFEDLLESANPDNKSAIKEAIGKALQQRENKR